MGTQTFWQADKEGGTMNLKFLWAPWGRTGWDFRGHLNPVWVGKTGLVGVQISICCVVLGLIANHAFLHCLASENATTLSPDSPQSRSFPTLKACTWSLDPPQSAQGGGLGRFLF